VNVIARSTLWIRTNATQFCVTSWFIIKLQSATWKGYSQIIVYFFIIFLPVYYLLPFVLWGFVNISSWDNLYIPTTAWQTFWNSQFYWGQWDNKFWLDWGPANLGYCKPTIMKRSILRRVAIAINFEVSHRGFETTV
jgi:hypothetical protein